MIQWLTSDVGVAKITKITGGLFEMFIIGLTGGIGTGKSTVAGILKEFGAAVVDADRVGHEIYHSHSIVWKEIVSRFGQQILQPSGEIDRKKLGAIVFSDSNARATLNRIVHPRIYERIEQKIEELAEHKIQVTVIEAAILIEARWDSVTDEVWVVESPITAVLTRLRENRGLSEEEATIRTSVQISDGERRRRADGVIDNSGDINMLRKNIESLWKKKRKERFA